MRRLNFGIGCMAIASMFFAASSCSDDLDEEGAALNSEDNSEQAYMAVTITSPYSDTRAEAEDVDNTFEYGTSAEQSITSATFCFYYENGNLASTTTVYQANVGTDSVTIAEKSHGTAKDAETDPIELEGTATVLVRDYDANRPPKYMITILNAPSGFTAPANLTEALQTTVGEPTLHNISNLPLSYMNGNKFIMTTSSYNRKNEDAVTDKGLYYVTALQASDFKETQALAKEAAANGQSVNVYVERLAVKVRIGLDKDLTTTPITDFNNHETYTAVPIGESFVINGVDGAKDTTQLYAEILGWGINTQPMLSYYFKHINTSWTSDNNSLGFVWDAAIYHRSYWAEAFPYGKLTADGLTGQYAYPDEYVPAYATVTRAASEAADDDYHMYYIKANDITAALDSEEYCPENTNSQAVFKKVGNYQAAATCALVKARLVDKDGIPQVVILFNDELYTAEAFKQLAINAVASNYSISGRALQPSDLKFVDATRLNGCVTVALTDEAVTTLNNTTTSDEINGAFRTFTLTADAVAYGNPDKGEYDPSNGLMYYCIPIEHMRGGIQSKQDLRNDKLRNILEGQFGVVRNHIYDLAIESVSNLGHGIYNPDEPIVPPLEKDDRYYIGVKVNILSWHNVQQHVTL
jgi:hypothetical protein